MPKPLPITLECASGTRFAGDTVTGTVYFHPKIAAKKDVTVVRVALKIDIRTHIRVQHGESSHLVKDRKSLLKLERVLWTSGPDAAFTTGSSVPLPFFFQLPDDDTYPPSMRCGGCNAGGSIQYKIHAVAERKSWFLINTKADSSFKFLPYDRTGGPELHLTSWSGPWTSENKVVTLRNSILNLFSGTGMVDVTVRLPKPTSIPLFKPIPVVLEVTCKSKLLSQTDSLDVSTFTFPRAPPVSDLEISLHTISHIRAKKHKRRRTEKTKLFHGGKGPHSGKDFRVKRTNPIWVPDMMNGLKGRWVETATFHCPVVFRCVPPFETPLLRCEVNLHVAINFPGIGNSWKGTVGPLNISSGISPSKNWDGMPPELELPTYRALSYEAEAEKEGVAEKL